MIGAEYCPEHRIRFQESGVSYQDINYQIIPATYALIHFREPEEHTGNVYFKRYMTLSEDIAWLLEKGYQLSDSEWFRRRFLEMTGKPLMEHLFYSVSMENTRMNRFEDFLSGRIMTESGKDHIIPEIGRQMGIILSIEERFGSIEAFMST